ncbi:tetratricopeptide repeat protein [Candidatus Desantisbacteria bacterium]|nr:tetratricopeptide repeat protein [Candidatus Desantisbacteria bacterium]
MSLNKKNFTIIIFILPFFIMSKVHAERIYSAEKQFWHIEKERIEILKKEKDIKPQKLEKLIKDYYEILNEYPSWDNAAQIYFIIANLHLMQKNEAEALKTFDKVIEKFKDNHEACAQANMARGNIFEKNKEIDKALEEYKMINKQYPDTRLAVNMPLFMAQFYIRNKKNESISKSLDDALIYYSNLIKDYPKSTLGYYNLNAAYQLKGNLDLALAQLKKILDINSKLMTIHFEIAKIYVRQANFKMAKNQINLVLKQYPENPQAKNALKETENYEKLYNENLGKLKSSANSTTGTKNIKANLQLAAFYLSAYKVEEAIAELQKALEIDPTQISVHIVLSQIYLQKNELDKAIEETNLVLKANQDDMGAHKNLASIYVRKEEYDKSIIHLKKILDKEPNNGEAHLMMGIISEKKKDVDQAIKEYTIVIKLLPNDSRAYNNLAYIYATKNDKLDTAFGYASKAMELSPQNGTVIDTLGYIYLLKGDYQKAITHFKDALKYLPAEPTIYYHLGYSYYKIGEKKDALSNLNKALEQNLVFSEADETKNLIRELSN